MAWTLSSIKPEGGDIALVTVTDSADGFTYTESIHLSAEGKTNFVAHAKAAQAKQAAAKVKEFNKATETTDLLARLNA